MYIKINAQPPQLENEYIKQRNIFIKSSYHGRLKLFLFVLLLSLVCYGLHIRGYLALPQMFSLLVAETQANSTVESPTSSMSNHTGSSKSSLELVKEKRRDLPMNIQTAGTVYNGVDSITSPIPTSKPVPPSKNQKKGSKPSANSTSGNTDVEPLKSPEVQPAVDQSAIIDNSQINKANQWGWTKLMFATVEGDLQTVKSLLASGANPDISDEDGRSPLMAASLNKHTAIAKALIGAKANVNLINRDGWTALCFAAWNGDGIITNTLLQAGADKDIKTVDGFSAKQLAKQKGHQIIVEILN